MSRYSKPRVFFVPLPLVALSLALNLHALAADSFWGDEILTAIFAGRSPAEVIHWTAGDIHPPFYYLLAGAFTRFTVPLGLTQDPTLVSDWLWRFPSVIAAVLTVAVTYRLGLWVSGAKCQVSSIKYQGSSIRGQGVGVTQYAIRNTSHTAIAAALLIALAPVAIKYGQEARMHALFMFLSALSTWLLFRALARPQKWRRWLAFSLATTASIYTMYFGFLILAAQACLVMSYWLFVLGRKPLSATDDQASTNAQTANDLLPIAQPPTPNRRPPALLSGFSSSISLACLAYLPWWPVLFSILRKRAAVGAIEGGVGEPLSFVRGVIQALGPRPEPLAWGFLLLFVVGLVFLARRCWPLAVFGGFWLALPVALPIVLGDPRALQFRYAFVLPVYLTIIAEAVAGIGERLSRKSINFFPASVSIYFVWLLATVSFIATLGVYNQTKPNWRGAAAYLDQHTTPADIILIGPLWDEGRFIDYYYRGQAELLTPAGLVTNIESRTEGMRTGGGRVWAVNRFMPAESPVLHHLAFSGVVISEPTLAVYEPDLLAEAAIDLARQAVEAAYPWAAAAEVQGVLDPDPRTAQAAALRALGDALVAAGRPEEALEPYQTAVDIFPGWVNGFITLAKTQETVGNYSAAAEAYRQAVVFNLTWHGPQADEAAALVKAKQWAEALKKYHQIIKE